MIKIKDRKRQRLNRRLKHKEELLDNKNDLGVKDLTAYNAVKQMVTNDGNYLRNQANDTILGKQVIISEYMPDVETGTKPIAFGDFSYYWIVERKLVTVRTLLEKFVLYDQIGYLAFEFLDGKLVRNEAIKVIQMADAGK